MSRDIIIIGGGLAGLCAAIDLSKRKLDVLVIEKNTYPKHKVCGEYVSNEVLPYLNSLDVNPFKFHAKKINRLILSTQKGRVVESNLPMGGFGLSRYTFDAVLAKKAKENGVSIINDTVLNAQFQNDAFSLITKSGKIYKAKIVIGAHGKRSNLDKKLNRSFINKSSPYLAVKAHYKADFSEDLVALHNFNGGYCGLSKVENNNINACYIVEYSSFKRYKNISNFQREVLYQNPHLKTFFEKATLVFENPLTISQIAFSKKELINNHVLMCGDSAGMIHPLCGNGMSMAIQSAQLLSSMVHDFFLGKITSRSDLESFYKKAWNRKLKPRLRTGKFLSSLFKLQFTSQAAFYGLNFAPNLMTRVIERTHGKPLVI